jgi:hypothetical protein
VGDASYSKEARSCVAQLDIKDLGLGCARGVTSDRVSVNVAQPEGLQGATRFMRTNHLVCTYMRTPSKPRN